MNPAALPLEHPIPARTWLESGALEDAAHSSSPEQPVLGEPGASFSPEAWLRKQAKAFEERALAENSVRGYKADWKSFESWCAQHGAQALPASADTLTYMVDRSRTLTKASLARAVAAISRVHRLGKHPNPTAAPRFRDVMQGIRRDKTDPQVPKRALLAEDLFDILDAIPGLKKHEAVELRDRALLVIGFTGALRRSELVGLDVKDIVRTKQGVVLQIRASKTDPNSAGTEVAIPKGRKPARCPVAMLDAWLSHAKIKEGPVFSRTARSSAGGSPTAALP